jgi:hypothetical protein
MFSTLLGQVDFFNHFAFFIDLEDFVCRPSYSRPRDFVVFVFDLSRVSSLEEIGRYIEVTRERNQKKLVEILVGNKSDLARHYSDQELAKLKTFPEIPTPESEIRYYDMYVSQYRETRLLPELCGLVASLLKPSESDLGGVEGGRCVMRSEVDAVMNTFGIDTYIETSAKSFVFVVFFLLLNHQHPKMCGNCLNFVVSKCVLPELDGAPKKKDEKPQMSNSVIVNEDFFFVFGIVFDSSFQNYFGCGRIRIAACRSAGSAFSAFLTICLCF